RPDKAFTPHPAVMGGWLMRRWRVLSGLHGSCNLLQLHDLVGRIRRLRRIRRLCADARCDAGASYQACMAPAIY
ncbi:hypothetical protein NVV43_19885, partial [Escherichia marmotae]|nr:hypothetical protein [Escherichia marmotae]